MKDIEMTTVRPEPSLIPIPENFPFEWENEADSKIAWATDPTHFPGQVTPLTGWLLRNYWIVAMSDGEAIIRRPTVWQGRRINTYQYFSRTPTVGPEQMAEAEKLAIKSIQEAFPGNPTRWEREWLPEIQGYHDKWNGFDLETASDSELVTHLEWSLATFHRAWEIHSQLMPAVRGASNTFTELYSDLFEDTKELEALNLLQGLESDTLRSGWDLWELSRSALESDGVSSIILNKPVANVMASLDEFDEGRKFIDEIHGYLADWGNRTDLILEVATPTWKENHEMTIENLKLYLKGGNEHPRDKWKEMVAERDRLAAEALDRLANYPEPIRKRFSDLLAGAQHSPHLQEDHNWWIDQQITAQLRFVYLEFGKRLANAGVIPNSDDVFMLTGDEISVSASSGFSGSFISEVAERIAEMDRWKKVEAPSSLGVVARARPDNLATRGMKVISGAINLSEEQANSDRLIGSSAAGGKVVATARVITELSDAGRLNQGEILVTITTMPPWTPLFAVAGGIVTDTGGVLSHAAIVAREYALPAVVGTVIGTKRIKDGQRIEVDGDAGTVRLLDA